MKTEFYKYQGTGNDFILIDNRDRRLPPENRQLYALWCNRRFGIGADGLILLEEDETCDFRMVYFNSDGRPSSMCGNGGRCLVSFAATLGLFHGEARFQAADGPHEAKLIPGGVSLKMNDVNSVEKIGKALFLNTGSPHYVCFSGQDVRGLDLVKEAHAIRYSARFREEGTNVNFVNTQGDHLYVRTYERGVEDETLSCGTGVTAVALASALDKPPGHHYGQKVETPGGQLSVTFFKDDAGAFSDVWLSGPATYVFKGEISY